MFHFRKSSQRTKDGGGEGGASASDKAQMAFKLYDRDKDGYITKAEMVKLSKNLTKDQVEKVHELNNLSDQNYNQGFAKFCKCNLQRAQVAIICTAKKRNVLFCIQFLLVFSCFRPFQSLTATGTVNLVLKSSRR